MLRVDHVNGININDIQLVAGHWNQPGVWTGDNDHDHLGQTWVGNDNPLVVNGTFDDPNSAPLILSNSNLNGEGLRIESMYYGVRVISPNYTGVSVETASGHGIFASSTAADGVRGFSSSADYYGGHFEIVANGGGVYARGGSNLAADLILGGTVNNDDGRI